MEYKTLNNGLKIPVLGFGTARMQGEKCYQALSKALECGYRLVDTAQMYQNHKSIAKALRANKIPRNELFIVSKISQNFTFSQTKDQIYRILDELDLKYLDSLLIHEPYKNSLQMYEAMQEAYENKLLKSLGVSNFNENLLFDFMKKVMIKPVLNQCETHLLYQQKSLHKTLQKHNIFLQSWSPFIANKNEILKHSLLVQMAKKYSKTPAQIILNFLYKREILLIPKSSNIQRMQENLEIFDFDLEDEDRKKLENLDTNKSFFGWYE
ncbi:aldo/keto reductase [Campylobacter jejuni]|uniref:aldo/keto reductase n=1 Tax=Campylobacter jejuni TaxID=197 RepID=UPI000F809B1D|nr:aldo/keto reductase [Campylobacter jejuni]EAH5435514.1 aldo/keto reductase [Campylobacter jejuni]EAI4732741.1 aldo/keto reductase [Campylobacter jejuni]EAJ3320632.1 aldo/keto reductase [Campylobacter jejuni]EAJ4841831.1 aldo/keto reductase [Campylobacter jejuni]EAK1650692.1 aldo/keto reductase [Campylobacter jejuni]